MPHFRHRHRLVEAHQWWPGSTVPGAQHHWGDPGSAYVESRHGPCPVHAGDWVVPDPDGRHYDAYSDVRLHELFEPVTP